jgi:hypothetical protein
MKSVSPQTPYGETLFCDDVRYEKNGKLSLIGVYHGDLISPRGFPFSLPKFVLFINYYELPSESTSPVQLKVFMPGDNPDTPTVDVALPVDEMRKTKPDPSMPGENPRLMLRNMLEISPFQVREAGIMRVRAYRDDLEIRMGSLWVRARPEPTPS